MLRVALLTELDIRERHNKFKINYLKLSNNEAINKRKSVSNYIHIYILLITCVSIKLSFLVQCWTLLFSRRERYISL